MRLKDGVKLLGIRPEMLVGLQIADTVYKAAGRELTVTSVSDGKHMRASAHYSGRAADLRINDVPQVDRSGIVISLKMALGAEFDVIHENIGLATEHVHIEFDPSVGVGG